MRWALVVCLGCGSKAASPPPFTPPPPRPRPVRVTPPQPSVRVDRPPLVLGGPPTWASAEISDLRFCPGDRELVITDRSQRLRRYRVDDGVQLAVTDNADGAVDCRADGTALAIDKAGSPILVDPKGAVTRPPKEIVAQHVRFDGDAVMALTDDEGVVRWAGAEITGVLKAHEHALGRALGDHGVYVERVYWPENKSQEGIWWTRGKDRIKLPGKNGVDVDRIAVAPDGAVAVADMMMAYGWVVKGKVAGPQTLLLDQSGFRINDIAATDKWFAVMDAGGGIWKTPRPAWKWTGIEKPCGEHVMATGMTISRDDTRIAVACEGIGVRILDLATGKQLSKDGINPAGNLVAWSASGAGLAVRGDSAITVWQGATRIATIEADDGRSLWWNSVSELGGTSNGALVTWTIADLTEHEAKRDAELAVRSKHGELALASRRRGSRGDALTIVSSDKLVEVELPATKHESLVGLAIDDAGKRALVWRGMYAGQPALEVLEIDVATATAQLREITTTAVALAGTGFVAAGKGGSLTWYLDGKPGVVGDHGDEVTAIAISGEVVAAGGADGRISLWWIKGGKLGVLPGHTAPVRALAFAPDGHRLASTASDGPRVWDLAP